MISAVILTKNNESEIIECIKHLSWCTEVVVIDDKSTDNTREVAKKLGAKVFERAMQNDFASQRNFALDHVKGDWALFVDVDERVSPELADEIYRSTSQFLTEFNGFLIKREDYMGGHKLSHGETGSIYLLRLGRVEKGKWRNNVHEVWDVAGNIGKLTMPLQHYPHQSIKEFLREINMYTSIRAKELYDNNVPFSFISLVSKPTGKFLVNYIFKLGFLDGTPGFINALMMSMHSFLVRGKLWQLHIKKKDFFS